MSASGSQFSRGGTRWTLVLTSVAFFMVALDALVVTTALPAVRRDVGGGVGTLEWVINAYLLAFAAGIIPAAALGDRLGRRRVYVAGLSLFVMASAACALAPTAEILIAARVVQGLGAAIVTPLSLTILTGAFPVERRGAVLGIWGAIAGLAIAAGPLVGGAVTQGLNWHWIFWVNVPIGAAAAVLSTVKLEESRGPRTSIDLPGLLLIATGAVGLAYGLVRAADEGWRAVDVDASLIAGAVLIVAFAAWERRTSEPMLPPRLFTRPGFTAAVAVGFLMTAAITSAAFLMSQFFQLGLGFSPLGTGIRFLPWTATPLLVAPLAGAWSDRVGRRPMLIAGLALQAAGLLAVAGLASTGVSYIELLVPLVVAGVGISMALPAATAAALNAAAPQDLGKAAGATNTLQRFGGVFGVAAVSALFAATGHLGSGATVIAGLKPALALAAGFSLLGALSAVAVTGRRSAVATPQAAVSLSEPGSLEREPVVAEVA
ncbi:MAG: DHA2 family efflux MFS transporter permease subunit [Candidatus Dormibacteraeota bacterium]|nr:DHA2 family efflux MFS transporter permease subunit [Candidatus Dormibacteraeota bacterium]